MTDVAPTPEAMEQAKQRYLLKTAVQSAIRTLYGDEFSRSHITDDLTEELLKRSVRNTR